MESRKFRAKTYNHAVASSILNNILQDPLDITHHDEHGQIDLEPILPLTLIYLLLQFCQEQLSKRKELAANDDVVELSVHDWSHWNYAIPWIVGLVTREES